MDAEEQRAEEGVEEEAIDQEEEEWTPNPRWATEERTTNQPIFVDVGRGDAVEVQPGSPFEETTNRLADEAHYGGYFRVYLNGSEIVNPEDAPAVFEPGMRVALTSYDKVG